MKPLCLGPNWRTFVAAVFSASVLCLPLGGSALAATSGTSLSRIEFQRKANAICATYTRRIAALGPTVTQAAVNRWATATKAQTSALAALRPPAIYAVRYRRMLSVSRAVLPVAVEAFEADRARETARFELLYEKATRMADERTRLANSIGLRTCGKQ